MPRARRHRRAAGRGRPSPPAGAGMVVARGGTYVCLSVCIIFLIGVFSIMLWAYINVCFCEPIIITHPTPTNKQTIPPNSSGTATPTTGGGEQQQQQPQPQPLGSLSLEGVGGRERKGSLSASSPVGGGGGMTSPRAGGRSRNGGCGCVLVFVFLRFRGVMVVGGLILKKMNTTPIPTTINPPTQPPPTAARSGRGTRASPRPSWSTRRSCAA